MEIITWKNVDPRENANQSKELNSTTTLKLSLINNNEPDEINTLDAINLCKVNLMGEYHGILVKQMSEVLDDAEVYLLTWDGESSEGGEMVRINSFVLNKIASGVLFLDK